jgi:23S rRNA pseudouridine1911/1915/1917 synthase
MQIIRLVSQTSQECWEIPVLFEDADLLAVSKPAGLLTSPDRYDPNRPNLMRLLHFGIENKVSWAAERGLTYLMNAHRLDFDTSGLLLLAKNKPALVTLANLFGAQKPYKKYVGLVHGSPSSAEFHVDEKIAPNLHRLGEMRIDSKRGKISVTNFAVRENFTGCTLVDCFPVTGRTHQIRIHLKHVGLPLVADTIYGGTPLLLSNLKRGYRLKPGRVELPLLQRVALHAESMKIPHPQTGELVQIDAPWPKDLTVAVKYLRRYATTSASAVQDADE